MKEKTSKLSELNSYDDISAPNYFLMVLLDWLCFLVFVCFIMTSSGTYFSQSTKIYVSKNSKFLIFQNSFFRLRSWEIYFSYFYFN